MKDPWQIELFGGLRARRGDQIISRFATAKVASLLARLAYPPLRPHRREELADLLWPDADPDTGRTNLRQALASLRRQLEPPGTPPGSVLIADRLHIRLDPAAVRSDVAEFERALKTAARAPDPQTRQATLSRALEQYQGELLPGFYEDWVLTERDRLGMAYERARDQREEGAVLAPPPVEEMPTAASPADPPTDPEMPLPSPRTPFFGREQELAQLETLLADPLSRIVTLSGAGGTGKTRLAVQAARQSARRFAAVVFVPVAEVTDATLLPGAIGDALRLPRSPNGDALTQVAEALTARPRVLLVLDNMEQIAEAGALLVSQLSARVPGLVCLVTSRHRLELAGEREFAMSPLPVPESPESEDTPECLMSVPSVQLFVSRAQLSRPDFQITPRNAGAVAALCRDLEGIPLALELAAAWAPVLTPSQMRARLSERFALLASRRKEVTPRHRTLWATVGWSWDLLPPDLRRFWARLSVFRGGWTAESAQEVCDEPQALYLLTQLRARSLVTLGDAGDAVRFGMLDSLREFAGEQLRGPECVQTARRHVRHFAALVKSLEESMTGPEQTAAFARLAQEHDNLRAALTWAARDDESIADGAEMGAALFRYWLNVSRLREGRDLLEAFLPAGSELPPALRSKVLNSVGVLAARLGEADAAQEHLKEALSLDEVLGNEKGAASVQNNLGLAAWVRRDSAEAGLRFQYALTAYRRLGLNSDIAGALFNLGVVAESQGDLDAARRSLEESLSLREVLGDRSAVAQCLQTLGKVAASAGDDDESERLLRRSLPLKAAVGHRLGVAITLHNLASLAGRRGDLPRVVRLFAFVERVIQETGDAVLDSEREERTRTLADARAALGPAAYDALRAEGWAMTQEQAITEGLGEAGAMPSK